MKVNFFNAKNGDAIHLETDAEKNIFIDMGYSKTYSNYIKEQIIKIADDNQNINLLIISHIDQDHIGGALHFLQDIKNNEFDKKIIYVYLSTQKWPTFQFKTGPLFLSF